MNPENNNQVYTITMQAGGRLTVAGHLPENKIVILEAGAKAVIEQGGSVPPATVFKCAVEEAGFVAAEAPAPLVPGTEITSMGDQLVVAGAGAPVAPVEGE